ncbi:uncharacterized protein, partial [Notothenia coriiceps]|uniref:Uncharacterized protein n=1 Tax=Notothenia coriiceps TaxID=8208 RepID=A0A6I9NKX0_9TELE
MSPNTSSVLLQQPEEMEPAMRPTRSAAKSAVGKMKVAARRWSKDVDRSRYGLRVHICKNPDLSPIAERPTPPRLTQQTPPHSCTAPNQEAHLNPEFSIDTQATVDLTDVLEDPSEVTSPPSCSESATGKSRKASVQRERSSGPKKMKVSCADDFLLVNQTEGTTEELREDQHTTNQEASRETPVPEEEVDAEQNLHTPAQSPCTDSEGKLENHGAPNSGGGSHKTLTVQRKTSLGRRGSRNICIKTEQAEPLQTLPDEEAQEQEDDIRSSSDSQEEEEEGGVGAAPVNLAPVNLAPVNLAPVNLAPLYLAPLYLAP